jgi:hypothetical protein
MLRRDTHNGRAAGGGNLRWQEGNVVTRNTQGSSKEVQITVYGDVAGPDETTGEIGGNKILVETGERTWFLDFGMGFGKAGRFFDEFLKPRSAVGLRDYLRLDLIPPLEGSCRCTARSSDGTSSAGRRRS